MVTLSGERRIAARVWNTGKSQIALSFGHQSRLIRCRRAACIQHQNTGPVSGKGLAEDYGTGVCGMNLLAPRSSSDGRCISSVAADASSGCMKKGGIPAIEEIRSSGVLTVTVDVSAAVISVLTFHQGDRAGSKPRIAVRRSSRDDERS